MLVSRKRHPLLPQLFGGESIPSQSGWQNDVYHLYYRHSRVLWTSSGNKWRSQQSLVRTASPKANDNSIDEWWICHCSLKCQRKDHCRVYQGASHLQIDSHVTYLLPPIHTHESNTHDAITLSIPFITWLMNPTCTLITYVEHPGETFPNLFLFLLMPRSSW